jgi:hypothetical protein
LAKDRVGFVSVLASRTLHGRLVALTLALPGTRCQQLALS